MALRFLFCAAVAANLAGCATQHQPACPAGQQRLRTAQFFFGREAGLSEAAFRKFLDEELTPRFRDGLTVVEGGAQWRGPENRMLRESAKVVLIVLPHDGDSGARLEAVRAAYKRRFKQDSVLVITQPACVSF